MIDREKLLDKIKKLRAKGADGAVGEAEANAFLDAAARMMAEHGLSDDDLAKAGIDIEPVEKSGVHTSIHKMHPACIVIDAIAKLTGTSIGLRVTSTKRNGKWREIGAFTIAGRPSDRQVADYLFDQVRNLIDAAWTAERAARFSRVEALVSNEPGYHPSMLRSSVMREFMSKNGFGVDRKERRSFQFGMARRFAERIEAMSTRHADSEMAMVVWREQNTVTEQKKSKPVDLDMRAFAKGGDAGKDTHLGHGMAAAQKAVAAIGN